MRDRLIIFAVIVGLAVLAALAWVAYEAKGQAKQSDDLARQLKGQLTEKERDFTAAHAEIGLVKSKLVTQEALEETYKKQLGEKDAEVTRLAKALEDFRKKHNAKVDSLTAANLRLEAVIKNGTGTGTVIPNDDPTKPATIAYSFSDEYGRFKLTDPDVMLSGNETFAISQNFKLTTVVLREKGGNLKAQQVSLREVVKDGEGWKTVGVAKVIDSEFSYAPDESVAKDDSIFDPHPIVEIGTTFRPEAPLNFGAGAILLRYSQFGLGPVLYSDFESLAGTGASAQVTWRPELADRPFNFGLAAGVGVNTDLSIRPHAGAIFVVY